MYFADNLSAIGGPRAIGSCARRQGARQATAAAAGVKANPAQGPRQPWTSARFFAARDDRASSARSKYRCLVRPSASHCMLQTPPPGMTRMFAVSAWSAPAQPEMAVVLRPSGSSPASPVMVRRIAMLLLTSHVRSR